MDIKEKLEAVEAAVVSENRQIAIIKDIYKTNDDGGLDKQWAIHETNIEALTHYKNLLEKAQDDEGGMPERVYVRLDEESQKLTDDFSFYHFPHCVEYYSPRALLEIGEE